MKHPGQSIRHAFQLQVPDICDGARKGLGVFCPLAPFMYLINKDL